MLYCILLHQEEPSMTGPDGLSRKTQCWGITVGKDCCFHALVAGSGWAGQFVKLDAGLRILHLIQSNSSYALNWIKEICNKEAVDQSVNCYFLLISTYLNN